MKPSVVILQLVLLLQICCCSITAAVARSSISQWQVLNADGTPAIDDGGQQQDDVCAKWGLQPRTSRNPPRVFDFFIASHELDMMEIRLEELHSVVDRIFVVESRETFRGNPKPLAFPHVLHRLRAQVIAKVHYTVLDSLKGDDPWAKEHYQRGQMVNTSLASAGITVDPQDVFIMSDLDEIPKPEFVRAMKQCSITYPIVLDSTNHFYSFNYVTANRTMREWGLGPDAMQAWQHDSLDPQQLRFAVQGELVLEGVTIQHYSNAAWHCSYCFGHAAAFLTKLSSFSHAEFDTPFHKNLYRLMRCLKEGWSLFEKNVGAAWLQPQWQRLPDSEELDVPQYLRDNAARFAYMLERSGPVAGLADVEVVNHNTLRLVRSNSHAHCQTSHFLPR